MSHPIVKKLVVLAGLILAPSAFAEDKVKVKKWKATAEAYAAKSRQADLTRLCGHGVKVVFDWASVKAEDWADVPKGDGTSGYSWTGEAFSDQCADGILTAMMDLCDDKDYKTALAPLKQLTCHVKPCDSLPRAAPGDKNKAPAYDFKLSKDRSTVDVGFCKDSQIFDSFTEWTPKKVLKKNF
jgi:hypothetical protein